MKYRFLLPMLAVAVMISPLSAKSKKAKAPQPKDEIQVVGHIPYTGEPVTRFFVTRHYSSSYLYAEHAGSGNATLIDVSRISQPVVLAQVAFGAGGNDNGLSVVAGTAALVSSEPAPASASAPQSLKIMDFSDPKNPKVAREFKGVTAMSRDDRRGLIFVANPEGVWILRQHLAEDPEVEKAYANYVVYGMSMYPPQ